MAKNRILLSDIISALFLCEGADIDLGGMVFVDGSFFNLSFAECPVSNVGFDDCVFEGIDLTDANPKDVSITNSVIIKADGVTSRESLPSWVTNCLIQDFQSINTLAAIRQAGLTVAQTFLLSSLRKLFLQPGSGRRHSSMYKGYGDSSTKRTCEKVIALLLREGFCQRFKGSSEDLYVPNRSLANRAKSIMSQMTQSKDDLWLKASNLRE